MVTPVNATSVGSAMNVSSSVGVYLAIAAGTINAVGLNLQKAGHGGGEFSFDYLKSWIWWIGLATILTSELIGSIAYGFTTASIVSALGATTVFFNSIFAITYFGDILTPYKFVGLCTIAISCVLLALSAPSSNRIYNLRELEGLYSSPVSLTYFVASSISIACLHLLRTRRFELIRLAVYAALVSTWTVIAVRGAVMLLVNVGSDCERCGCVNTIFSWLFALQVFIVVVTGLWAGAYVEQMGIGRFRQTEWVPIHYSACAILLGASSAIVYDERNISVRDWVGIAIGVVGCVWGVVLIIVD